MPAVKYAFFDITEAGYYSTHLSLDADKLPDMPMAIPLYRILRPHPMIGKKAMIRLPIGASTLQYDFIIGDCLPPFGNGKVADMQIDWTRPAAIRQAEAARNAFRTRFLGDGNGIIVVKTSAISSIAKSDLRSQQEAPESGYDCNGDFGDHFRGGMIVAYLRVRSQESGGPLFGKLCDPVSYWADSNEDRFEFEYVVNPSGNRGVEIDMGKITVPTHHELEYPPEEF